MPYGLKRFQKAEALHFITFSCSHRIAAPDFSLELNGTHSTFIPETLAQRNWQGKIVRVIIFLYGFSDQNLRHLLPGVRAAHEQARLRQPLSPVQ
jgi:hypothetical protein